MRSFVTGVSPRAILSGVVITFFLTGLGGCTPNVWYHREQNDPLNFRRDISQCQQEAAEFGARIAEKDRKAAVKERTKACMKARGYGWGTVNEVPDDSFVFEEKDQSDDYRLK